MATEPNVKDRRKDYFIKKRFQATFVLYYLIGVILTSVIMGIFLYKNLSDTIDYNRFMAHSTYTNTWDLFQGLVKRTTVIMLVVSIGMTLLASLIVYLYINLQCRRIAALTRPPEQPDAPPPPNPWAPRSSGSSPERSRRSTAGTLGKGRTWHGTSPPWARRLTEPSRKLPRES